MLDLPVLAPVAAVDQSACNGCDECGARCVADVRMTRAEFEAIAAYRAGPAAEEVLAVERQEKLLPYPGTDPGDAPLATYRACRFRDGERGRCAVYPVRPVICRLFGHVEWLPCPIQKIPVSLPDGPSLMRAYSAQPLRTYEEWEATVLAGASASG